MSSEEHVRNIAVVGASGLVGGEILKSLLHSGTFNVTVLSRQNSTATFAPGITVKKGDYKSSDFLESALRGQDVLIITLAVTTSPEVQSDLIKAAAKAGVPWILPNEYGQDGANAELSEAVIFLGHKAKYRNEIEELGRSSWIGVASNLWFDYSLKGGFYGIDISARKAEIYDDGTNAITATTVPQVGRAVARLLSLPVQASYSSSSPTLSDYKNKFVYITSFSVTQNDMLGAVQRATGTDMPDWTVAHTSVDQFIQNGRDKFAKGDRWGMINVMYGCTFKRGLGDQFHGREVANEKLGLKEEDLDEVVRRVVKEVEGK
ncbi:MAG: hypothetical protein Q9217_001278 [Psora testacea]